MAIGHRPAQTTLLRDGRILIKVKNSTEAGKLEQINLNHGENKVETKVYKHEQLNSSKGILRCDAFVLMSEKELLEGHRKKLRR